LIKASPDAAIWSIALAIPPGFQTLGQWITTSLSQLFVTRESPRVFT
jgi:hypothetical protein